MEDATASTTQLRKQNALWRIHSLDPSTLGRSQARLAHHLGKRRNSMPSMWTCHGDLDAAEHGGLGLLATVGEECSFDASTFPHTSSPRGLLLGKEQQPWEQRSYAFCLSHLEPYRGEDGCLRAPKLVRRTSSDSSGAEVFSMDCGGLAGGERTAPPSAEWCAGASFAPEESERVLRLAFTEYHNNGTFAFGNSFAYLGDNLSVMADNSLHAFRAEDDAAACSPAFVIRRPSASCGALKWEAAEAAAGLTLAPFSSPSEGKVRSISSVSSANDEEEGVFACPEPSLAPAAADITQQVRQKPATARCALQPFPASDAATAAATGHVSGWVSPCIGGAMALLSPPVRSALGCAAPSLCAGTYDPMTTYLLTGVSIASAAPEGDGPAEWVTRTVTLRQNVLLEFSAPEEAESGSAPSGFAMLCGASVSRCGEREVRVAARATAPTRSNASDAAAAALAPPPRASATVFYVRGETATETDTWLALLSAAARLSLADLFEFDRSDGRAAAAAAAAAACTSTSTHSTTSTLGAGRFASVKKARRNGGVGPSASACALKVFDKAEFWQRVEAQQERPDTLLREATLHASLTAAQRGAGGRCPIVRLHSVFETADAFVVEMELMSRSNLFHELAQSGPMAEAKAAPVVRCLLEAVDACQRRGIAHRDIKLSNILCPCDAPEGSAAAASGAYPPVKLADFGMAGAVGADGCLRGRCGTPGYVAPEILRSGPYAPYGSNVDTYSVGVVAYTLLCGYEPFYGQTDAELLAQNRSGAFEFHLSDWCEISLTAQDLIAALMEADPAKRPTAAQALQHEWLSARHEPPRRRGGARRSGRDGFFSESASTTEEELDDEASWM